MLSYNHRSKGKTLGTQAPGVKPTDAIFISPPAAARWNLPGMDGARWAGAGTGQSRMDGLCPKNSLRTRTSRWYHPSP